MTDGLNWGIIGTGWISQKLAEGIKQVPGANLWSVASRSADRAAAFAAQHGAHKHYASNEDFANDPDLDVAVIGTPHANHHAETILCLNAGKHVLCEKALALNSRQVEEMIAAAQANNRFLMEAMWTWFIPATIKAKELLDSGAIGEPRMLTAFFGMPRPFDAHDRFHNPELGGGSLLDQGVYPLSVSLYMFGKPDTIVTQAHLGATGVDEQSSTVLKYADGRLATCSASLKSYGSNLAFIAGSEGRLQLHPRFWHSERVSLHYPDGQSQTFDLPLEGNGYNYEIAEVMRCIAEGKLESDVMSWQASRDLMGMMDALRADWGVRYPGE